MLEMRLPNVANCEHSIEINKDAFREYCLWQRDSSHALSRGNAAEIRDPRSGQRLRHRSVGPVQVQASFPLLCSPGDHQAGGKDHTGTDKGENTSHPEEEEESEEPDDNGANREVPRLICICRGRWNASMICLGHSMPQEKASVRHICSVHCSPPLKRLPNILLVVFLLLV